MFRCASRPAFLSLPRRHRSSLPLPFRSVCAPPVSARRGDPRCHEVSRSVMRCHVPGRPPPVLPCLASPASFLLPAPGLRAARPFFARIACARGRAFRAGAVRAPDCAREPGARHTYPVRSVGAFFRAGAKPETKRPPDAASSCLILPWFFQGQALFRNYFSNARTRPASRQIMSRPAAGRAGTAPRRRLRAAAPRSSQGGASAGARPGRRESRLRRARRSAAKVCGSATASRSSPPRSADGSMTGGFEAAPVPCEPPACGNGNDREARTLLPLSTSCY